MTTIHFHANAEKPDAAYEKARLTQTALRLGLGVAEGPGDPADVIVALGGDGTILCAVREFPERPVLGLNLGGLGYLASVERRDFDTALEMLAAGRYRIASRTALAVCGCGSAPAHGYTALNDIVLMREMSGHAARLDLSVEGRTATRYLADGLIVATPTGSTAYSLAAGGPVLMPDSRSFVVTPMNPHALGVRAMVVSDETRFTVTSRARTHGSAEKIGIYADGENVGLLGCDESVEIRRAAHHVSLVELEGYDPYEVLARKLGWNGSPLR